MMDYLSSEDEENTDEVNSWMTYLKESHPEHFSVWSFIKNDFNQNDALMTSSHMTFEFYPDFW